VGASLPLRLCTLCTAAPLHCCRVLPAVVRAREPSLASRPTCMFPVPPVYCLQLFRTRTCSAALVEFCSGSVPSLGLMFLLLACLLASPRLACTTTSQPSPQPSPAQCRRRASILCCALSARPSWDLHPCCAPPSCLHPRATHAQPSGNRPTLACPRQPTHAHASPSPTPARREPRRAETSRDCAT